MKKRTRCDSKKGGWKCKDCNIIFRTKREYYSHRKSVVHQIPVPKYDFTCPFCNKTWETRKSGFMYHVNRCIDNPDRVESYWTGKKHSELSKMKISESMRIAHVEGRAYVWKHRMTESSRPEQFLIDVLQNEFGMRNGIDYERETPYKGFFLDFCWPARKLVIEMDGEQHKINPKQIERDIRKDSLLREDGYKELRIPWKECFNNPKDWIIKIKDFLDIKDSFGEQVEMLN